MAKKKEDTKAKSKQVKEIKAVKATARTTTTVKDTVASTRIVKPSVAPAKQDTKAVLQRWHMVTGIVLAVQGLLIALFSSSKAVPIVVHYPALDTLATEANNQQVFGVAARALVDMPIAYLLSAGLLAMAVVYIASATIFRKQFESVLDRGVNTARWIAYGLGGALLLDAVYLLSGITDLLTLKLLAGAVIGACVAGLAVDLLGPNRPGLTRLLKVVAVVIGVLPWLAIAGILSATMMYDGTVPSYMYGVYASGFILYAAIGLALAMRWQGKGRWANTLYSEKMFLILGLVTATVLAWQIFAGALL
jgi:hypothetical protein